MLPEPSDIDRSPCVPAVEQLLHQFWSKSNGLQGFDEIAIVQASLDDASAMRLGREFIKEMDCIGVLPEVDEPDPDTTVVAVGIGNSSWPELGSFRVVLAPHKELLVVRREGNDGIRCNGPHEPQIRKLIWIVHPASVVAKSSHLAINTRCDNSIEMNLRKLFLLVAIALCVKPPSVVHFHLLVALWTWEKSGCGVLGQRMIILLHWLAIRPIQVRPEGRSLGSSTSKGSGVP
mmetsp:Transcript_52956/g.85739  ORF Transcript_52956/g.85739 Transcript_52956/m.85739 type:complete len:233 (-) Transcript_52956:270-968(-)